MIDTHLFKSISYVVDDDIREERFSQIYVNLANVLDYENAADICEFEYDGDITSVTYFNGITRYLCINLIEFHSIMKKYNESKIIWIIRSKFN